MDITTLIGLTTSSIEIVRKLKDGISVINEVDMKLNLAELSNALADIKIEMADIKTALASKDEEISKLKQQLTLKQNVKWNAFYYSLEVSGALSGEYCPRCWDADNKLIRLKNIGGNDWQCLNCDNYFNDPNDTSYKPSSY